MALRKPVPEVTHEEVLFVKGKCNKLVDDNFSLAEHFDSRLASFLKPLVFASCQHALPTLYQLAGGIGNATNGAKINMWNTGNTPLSTIQFYVGDSQHGKSRLAAFLAATIGKTDEMVAARVTEMLESGPLQGKEKT